MKLFYQNRIPNDIFYKNNALQCNAYAGLCITPPIPRDA